MRNPATISGPIVINSSVHFIHRRIVQVNSFNIYCFAAGLHKSIQAKPAGFELNSGGLTREDIGCRKITIYWPTGTQK